MHCAYIFYAKKPAWAPNIEISKSLKISSKKNHTHVIFVGITHNFCWPKIELVVDKSFICQPAGDISLENEDSF